jgi:hypothetical protein
LGEIVFEKNGGKKEREKDEVHVESFGGVEIFLMSVENLRDG